MKAIVFSCIFSVTLSGCASVKFYDDDKFKHETGLKYFEAKPYLLVSHKAKDQSDVQVIYLPDKDKPQYAVFSPGMGSHEFSVGVSNGMLSSYGQKADPKVAEMVQAMTGLLSEGVKTAEKAGVFGVQGAPNHAKLALDVNGVAGNLAGVKNIALPDEEKSMDKIGQIIQVLENAVTDLKKPVVDDNKVASVLKESRDSLKLLSVKLPDKFDPASQPARYNTILDVSIKRLDAVIKELSPETVPAPEAAFALYEIVQNPGSGTTLKKVTP